MRRTRSSNSLLECLPSELFLNVAEFADFDARLALSATNSNCRTLLLPIIFRTLKITSDEKEANEILAIVERIGGNVQAISMHGTAEPNLSAEEEQENNADMPKEEDINAQRRKLRHQEQILAPSVARLLRGEHFPNMTTLIVHFDFDFDNQENDDGVWDSRDDLCDGSSMYVFTVEETSKDMIDESEAEFPWRRLMAQTWAAVSENKNITELVVRDLIPKAVSPWFSPQWKRFLAQISIADIQIWGGGNGAGWEVGTLEGYMYFVSMMDTYFFNHMENTTKLGLSCYEHGPLGSLWTGARNTMSLRSGCFPQLKELQLQYAVICPELVVFLESIAGTLEYLTLHECFASNEYPVRLTWADFFSALRKFDPKWKSFNVMNNGTPPLTFREWQESKSEKKDGEKQDDESEEVQIVRAKLASDPNSRLFLYATLTDKYGDRWPDEESIIEHFNKGKDLEEFNKLLDLVQRNNADQGFEAKP